MSTHRHPDLVPSYRYAALEAEWQEAADARDARITRLTRGNAKLRKQAKRVDQLERDVANSSHDDVYPRSASHPRDQR
jgi:hypothetical protein